MGIFPLAPLNFVDETNTAQGLYPSLINEIARRENWSVNYVEGSWARCLERLQDGEIDLMISIAHSGFH